MYIPNLVNVMYIKKNTLSLAHLLICISYAVLLKNHIVYISVCPPYISIEKCYVYEQSRQCYVYKNEYSLLLTNFELSLEVASKMEIT